MNYEADYLKVVYIKKKKKFLSLEKTFCLFKNYNNGLLKKQCPPVEPGTKYTSGIPVEEEFTPQQCLERIGKAQDGLQLRAVVDLSYTDKYYNKQVRTLIAAACAGSKYAHAYVGLVSTYCHIYTTTAYLLWVIF